MSIKERFMMCVCAAMNASIMAFVGALALSAVVFILGLLVGFAIFWGHFIGAVIGAI